jgi:hypothetical protein
LALEFALSHAFRNWSFADQFPSLSGHPSANDVWIGLRKSERRQMVYAAWADGMWLAPYIVMEDWSVEECTDLLAKDGPVPHNG